MFRRTARLLRDHKSHIAQLLRACGDHDSARNELRWLAEHAAEVARRRVTSGDGTRGLLSQCRSNLLEGFVERRSKGEPLQYILGTEYFGDLKLNCRPGVLIPRQETAACISYLVRRLPTLQIPKHHLRVLDLCTGTGCIPLLFQHELAAQRNGAVTLDTLAVDISPSAIALARQNTADLLALYKAEAATAPPPEQPVYSARIQALESLHFLQANVLEDPAAADPDTDIPYITDALAARDQHTWDVLVSNPPYISPAGFERDTAHSVRAYEPKLALVPPRLKGCEGDTEQGDLFYPRLLGLAEKVGARVVMVEVADAEQAGRVVRMVRARGVWEGVEVWRDEPEVEVEGEEVEVEECVVRGWGEGRAVFCWRR